MSENPSDGPLSPSASKADLVYRRLSEAILDGTMRPLARLNADEIARRLGVSKIPVREALQRLEIQGLVTQTQHAGASVAPLSLAEVDGIRHARLALDGQIARLAAERATDDGIARIRSIQARMRDAAARGDLRPLVELNRDFHVAIADATGYEVLVELVETTLLRVRRYRAVMAITAEQWTSLLDEHDAILRGIEERAPDAADRAARDHVAGRFALGGSEFRVVPELLGG